MREHSTGEVEPRDSLLRSHRSGTTRHFRNVGLDAGCPDLMDEFVDLIHGDHGEPTASDADKTLYKLRLFHRVLAGYLTQHA